LKKFIFLTGIQKKQLFNKENKLKKYGRCFNCNRMMSMKYLEQIEYYNGHKIEGSFHHNLICRTCKKKANQIFNSGENNE